MVSRPCLRIQGEHDHAIEDLTKAIELKPDYANAYYFRGRVWLANFTKKRWQEAKSDLTAAKDMD